MDCPMISAQADTPGARVPRQGYAFYRLPAGADGGVVRSPQLRHVRVYVDLGSHGGPVHAQVLARYARSVVEGRPVGVPLQGNPPAHLRWHILRESGLDAYMVPTPHELPLSMRSPAWQALCDSLDGWTALATPMRPTVTSLLNRLGFHRLVRDLIAEPDANEISRDPVVASLALARANAAHKLDRTGEESLRLMHRVYRNAPSARQRLGAALNIAVHHARVTHSAEQVRAWTDRLRAAHERVGVAEPSDVVMSSAVLRAASFGPFFAGHVAETTALLDECEQLAWQAPDDTEDLALLKAENLRAMLETRSREAQWSGDIELAVHRQRALVRHDPLDGRLHSDLGVTLLRHRGPADALAYFEQAATLGPPFTAVSWALVGYCRGRLGASAAARRALMAAVRLDPGAVSVFDSLSRDGDRAVARWARTRLAALPPLPVYARPNRQGDAR
jgi:tetratricopeptide (TPR) repeat protein